MEPISTAIATAVATGLAKDAVKTGYEKLKSLIFGASPEKKTELEQAIATVEQAQKELQRLVAASGLAQNQQIQMQAAELMQSAGNEIAVTGNGNATAINHSKALVVGGNAGDITL